MKKVLFVTNELYPYAKGGIGRLIYNYIVWNSKQSGRADIHVLLLGDHQRSGERWSAEHLDGVTVHVCEQIGHLRRDQVAYLDGISAPAVREQVKTSIVAANAIEDLYQLLGLKFDFIEFPDFMGIAYAAQNRKILGAKAFLSSRIVVRLHSSMSLIQEDEGEHHNPSPWFSAVTDIERLSLARADVVVGHLECIVEQNQNFFGFDDAWSGRAHVEFPPILLTESERRNSQKRQLAGMAPVDPTGARSFVFSSRLQPFKRPDLFIRGAAAYLRRFPDSQDQFLLMSYGWGDDYIGWLHSLIPYDLSDRIRLITRYTPAERTAAMANACIVIPSTFESLCIFAYESFLLGRPVILNARCPAFAESPFWRDGENCIHFDGSPEGLADAFERALSFAPAMHCKLPETHPYWTALPAAPAASKGEAATLDVVFTDVAAANSGATGPERALQIAEFRQAGNIGGFSAFEDRLYAPGAEDSSTPPEIVNIPVYGAFPDLKALQRAVAQGHSEFILFCPSDTLPSAQWCADISGVLANVRGAGIAFATEDRSGKVSVPLLDWPNVVASGAQTSLQPVALRRSVVETMLGQARYHEHPLTALLLDAVYGDLAIDVVDLRLLTSGTKTALHYPEHRYTAERMTAAVRRRCPQLGAANRDFTKRRGHYDSSEWRALDYRPEDTPRRMHRSASGVSFSEVDLTVHAATPDRVEGRVILSAVAAGQRQFDELLVNFKVDQGRPDLLLEGRGGEVEVPALEVNRAGIFVLTEAKSAPLDILHPETAGTVALVTALLQRLPIWVNLCFVRARRAPGEWQESAMQQELALIESRLRAMVVLSLRPAG